MISCLMFIYVHEWSYNSSKRILKYLKTINVGYALLNLVGFSNFDFTSCKFDRKSTSGRGHSLGSNVVS